VRKRHYPFDDDYVQSRFEEKHENKQSSWLDRGGQNGDSGIQTSIDYHHGFSVDEPPQQQQQVRLVNIVSTENTWSDKLQRNQDYIDTRICSVSHRIVCLCYNKTVLCRSVFPNLDCDPSIGQGTTLSWSR